MSGTWEEGRIFPWPGEPPQVSPMQVSPCLAYLMQKPQSRLYIGFTADLGRRARQHQEDKGGWTCGRGPWGLV
jgi:hypothetical protein